MVQLALERVKREGATNGRAEVKDVFLRRRLPRRVAAEGPRNTPKTGELVTHRMNGFANQSHGVPKPWAL